MGAVKKVASGPRLDKMVGGRSQVAGAVIASHSEVSAVLLPLTACFRGLLGTINHCGTTPHPLY